ncbi:MAG TPA: hypothetical protein DCZ95_13310 [Verrucomicrobia bacterium]|nr:MAG: hypothetical protein A2X46_11170 [Lentisphaerae bacterium GWF2_57_35]HBA85064.1 hypothetical protein [Verrucomicrobiota bacterium]
MKHPSRQIIAAAGLIAALSLTSACRTHITSAGVTMESYPSNRVTVNSRLFGGWFAVVNSALAKGDNELLQATVSLENLKNDDAQIEFRFRWIDAQGIEVTSGSSVWRARGAGARETLLLSGIAPAKTAVDFILDVRFVHNSRRW